MLRRLGAHLSIFRKLQGHGGSPGPQESFATPSNQFRKIPVWVFKLLTRLVRGIVDSRLVALPESTRLRPFSPLDFLASLRQTLFNPNRSPAGYLRPQHLGQK